ncbi:hypothetical protein ACHAXR_002296 [Thalassiosira sp. AJA248-18]
MNILRPSILHPSQVSRRYMVANNLNDPNVNAANFSWKYWRRANRSYSACWNQLRRHHPITAGLHYDDVHVNNGTHTQQNKRFSLRAYSSPPSLFPLNIKYTAMALTPKLSEESTTNFSVRCMNNNLTNSRLDFSTSGAMMPHSTIANGKKGDKEKTNEDGDMESVPTSQKFRYLFKKYGTVFVVTYFGIYFTTLLSFFVSLDSGYLDPETLSQIFKVSKNMACETADVIGPAGTGASMNEAANAYADDCQTEVTKDTRTLVDIVTGYLLSWDWTSKYAEKLAENPHLANLAVAWFIVKFTEPMRLAAAVIVTPKVAKVLGKKEAKDEAEKNASRDDC